MLFKYILSFSSKEATLARAGGKGANLARLLQACFNVPPGFILTTGAYRTFVEANQLQPGILGLVHAIQPEDEAALDNASAEIRLLFEQGRMPEEIGEEILSAYRALSASPAPIAVRSSATAEDLPGLAFAGQQDTCLNIRGENELLEAVRRCWGSLWSARAIAYRRRNRIPPDEIALAVVVQKMIMSETSGVAFTANPISGKRDEIIIDATFGLGEAVVSGQVDPDRYIVDPIAWKITGRRLGVKGMAVLPDTAGGTRQVRREANQEQALADQQILDLAKTAWRTADYFGAPQDIEWAWANEELYLLQARPITSLYPLPEGSLTNSTLTGSAFKSQELRVYVNFNAIQGIREPLTPLGMDTLRMVFSGVIRLLRIHSSMDKLLPAAGDRLFLDFTGLVRDPRLQKAGLALLAETEPSAQQILLRLIEDGRIPPKRVLTLRRSLALFLALLPILRRPLAAMLWPERLRPALVADAEQYLAEVRRHAQAAKELDACLKAMERDLPEAERISLNVMPSVLPVLSGGLRLVQHWLSAWLDEPPGAALQLMQGLPGNVTIEMDLKLWEAAQRIRSAVGADTLDRLRAEPVEELVADYRKRRLPAPAQRAIEAFLEDYGMRGMAEIDIGARRWRDDPTPVLQSLLGYLRLEDPLQAPDVLFQDRVVQAERRVKEYVERTRKLRFGWLRARLLGGLLRRMRMLGGLREAPLFYLTQVLDVYRSALLRSARQLVEQGELENSEDIFFVPFQALKRFAGGEEANLKIIAAANRTSYERERLRKQMPHVLLSTGEAFYEGMPGAPAGDHVLVGDAVSPGIAEGRACVIFDPQHAHLEPGGILVCPATDPGWTPLFLTAGGLVLEIGGMMTHGSIVAREYGIPAVVGVHQATTRLRDGQRLRVDGNRGHVTIIE